MPFRASRRSSLSLPFDSSVSASRSTEIEALCYGCQARLAAGDLFTRLSEMAIRYLRRMVWGLGGSAETSTRFCAGACINGDVRPFSLLEPRSFSSQQLELHGDLRLP